MHERNENGETVAAAAVGLKEPDADFAPVAEAFAALGIEATLRAVPPVGKLARVAASEPLVLEVLDLDDRFALIVGENGSGGVLVFRDRAMRARVAELLEPLTSEPEVGTLRGVTVIIRSPARETGKGEPSGILPSSVRELLMREIHRRCHARNVGAHGTRGGLSRGVFDTVSETLRLFAGDEAPPNATIDVELVAAGDDSFAATATISLGGAS